MAYIGINNKSRSVSAIYLGKENKAHNISTAYASVNGKATVCYSNNQYGDYDFHVTIVTSTANQDVTFKMNGFKDWGDGSEINESKSHTYAVPGEYTISCNGKKTESYMFGQSYWGTSNLVLSAKINIAQISDSAFAGCTSLQSVEFGPRFKQCGFSSFSQCGNLRSIYITDMSAWCSSVHNFPNSYDLYLNDVLVENLQIPGSVFLIRDDVFAKCQSIRTVTFSSPVSTGDSTFYNCENLTAVYAPNWDTWYNMNFYDYQGNPLYYAHNLYINGQLVTTAEIPENIVEIPSNIFAGCNLNSIVLHDKVELIGRHAFTHCTNITEITIPDSVTTISHYAFNACTGLNTLRIGSGLRSVLTGAFQSNSGIDVYVDGIEHWLNISFADLESQPLNNALSNLYANGELVTQVTFPRSIKWIGNYVFYGYQRLQNIVISEGIESIGYESFTYCSGLTSVEIPNSVETICTGAFKYCQGITHLTFGSNLTEIGEFAFYGCDGLTNIELPEGVIQIGSFAFGLCDGLLSASIPSTATNLWRSLFNQDRALQNVYIYAPYSTSEQMSYDYSWFQQCNSDLVIHIPASVTNPSQAYGQYWNYYNSTDQLAYVADL